MGTAIKIVPDAEPNADGEWINVDFDVPPTTSWIETAQYLERFIPKGFHLVATGGRTHDIASEDIWNVPAGAL